MKRAVAVLAGCLAVSACSLPGSMYHPAQADFYKDLPQSYPVKGKVQVKDVSSALGKYDMVSAEGYREGLERILNSARMTYNDETKVRDGAQYALNAKIMDHDLPSHGMMHVTCGAAVSYQLIDLKTENEVYSKTITSTFEQKKGFFEDAGPVMQQACGIAFGENAVQLVRELTLFNPKQPDPATTPIRRLKGAL